MDHDEVHVWRASLALPAERVAELTRTLSSDESEQAARFLSDLHRARFIAGRAIQRDILAQYLNTTAAAIVYDSSLRGKPRLAGAAAASGLTFNVSNSGDLSVCAIARGRAIGVDIEQVRPVPHASTVAERFFTADECAALEAVPDTERGAAFLRLWVRREARLKALGTGVWDSPRADPVARSDSNERLAPTPARGAPVVTTWVSRTLELGRNCIGELVLEGDAPIRVSHFDWNNIG